MDEIIHQFGTLNSLTGCGLVMMLKAFLRFLKNQIQVRSMMAYHQQANGLVKRTIQMIKVML